MFNRGKRCAGSLKCGHCRGSPSIRGFLLRCLASWLAKGVVAFVDGLRRLRGFRSPRTVFVLCRSIRVKNRSGGADPSVSLQRNQGWDHVSSRLTAKWQRLVPDHEKGGKFRVGDLAVPLTLLSGLIAGRNHTALSRLPHEQNQGSRCQEQEAHDSEHLDEADEGRLLLEHAVKDTEATSPRRAPVESLMEKESPYLPQKLLASQVVGCDVSCELDNLKEQLPSRSQTATGGSLRKPWADAPRNRATSL